MKLCILASVTNYDMIPLSGCLGHVDTTSNRQQSQMLQAQEQNPLHEHVSASPAYMAITTVAGYSTRSVDPAWSSMIMGEAFPV